MAGAELLDHVQGPQGSHDLSVNFGKGYGHSETKSHRFQSADQGVVVENENMIDLGVWFVLCRQSFLPDHLQQRSLAMVTLQGVPRGMSISAGCLDLWLICWLQQLRPQYVWVRGPHPRFHRRPHFCVHDAGAVCVADAQIPQLLWR